MGRKMTAERADRKKHDSSSKDKTPKSARKSRKKGSMQGHFTTAYVKPDQLSRYGRSVQTADVTEAEAMQKRQVKTARYEIRFTPQQQEMMDKASSILGYKNATDYIRHVMQENATKVIKEQVLLQIAEQDRQRFMEELVTPSAPSQSFNRGVALFNKTFKD